MDPVEEHRLRRWIEGVLKKEGHRLQKTRNDDPEFVRLGRWSRWFFDKSMHKACLVETHIDLRQLAERCVGYLDQKETGLRR